jgi:hypothetical protein
MKPQTWYAGRLVAPMLGLKEGELVAIRRAIQTVPLLVGPVFILFRRKNPLSIRFCESMGVRTVIHLFPNNVNPKPAPAELNEEIEDAYQKYLKSKPLGKRLPADERRKARQILPSATPIESQHYKEHP